MITTGKIPRFKKTSLVLENGGRLFLNEEYIKRYQDSLISFLSSQDGMKEEYFAKRIVLSQEIKSNNTIEGIMDDISLIEGVLEKDVTIPPEKKKRIVNLHRGYQYIFSKKEITKETLNELYQILSEDILDDYAVKNMGDYYRTKPVFILRKNSLSLEPYQGYDAKDLDYYMNKFIDYINEPNEQTGIDHFIKSQIMHFYFVLVHPYFDVNGRTSRTLSMWYMYNNSIYPYLIFNRAIAYSRKDYETAIEACRERGEVTLFLKYMLNNVEREFEKEYIVDTIKNNSPFQLSNQESQMLEYFLTMKGNLTAKDLAIFYNRFNSPKKTLTIVNENIRPLIDKNILLVGENTNGKLSSGHSNFNIYLSEKVVDINSERIKTLSLIDYIKPKK